MPEELYILYARNFLNSPGWIKDNFFSFQSMDLKKVFNRKEIQP